MLKKWWCAGKAFAIGPSSRHRQNSVLSSSCRSAPCTSQALVGEEKTHPIQTKRRDACGCLAKEPPCIDLKKINLD